MAPNINFVATDREQFATRFKAKIRIRSLARKLQTMSPAEREKFVQGFMAGLRTRQQRPVSASQAKAGFR